MTATNKKFESVEEMVRALSQSPDFPKESERYAAERELTHKLFALRSLKGVSQEAIAREMECTQGRVSKLEAMPDAKLRIGDLARYLSAIDMELRVVVAPKSTTMPEEVKYHWMCVTRLLEKMVACVGDDPDIRRGVSDFHFQTAANFLRVICASMSKLRPPRHENAPERITVDVVGFDDCHEASHEASDTPCPSSSVPG